MFISLIIGGEVLYLMPGASQPGDFVEHDSLESAALIAELADRKDAHDHASFLECWLGRLKTPITPEIDYSDGASVDREQKGRPDLANCKYTCAGQAVSAEFGVKLRHVHFNS